MGRGAGSATRALLNYPVENPALITAFWRVPETVVPRSLAGHPRRYYSYFENCKQEQAVFIYDPTINDACIGLEREGWRRPIPVQDGVSGTALEADEQMWLSGCWRATESLRSRPGSGAQFSETVFWRIPPRLLLPRRGQSPSDLYLGLFQNSRDEQLLFSCERSTGRSLLRLEIRGWDAFPLIRPDPLLRWCGVRRHDEMVPVSRNGLGVSLERDELEWLEGCLRATARYRD